MKSRKTKSILNGVVTVLFIVLLVIPVQATRGNAAELLKQMPYYGDISKCTMTAEQAEAFAKLIENGIAGKVPFSSPSESDVFYWNQPFEVLGYESYETNRANVMLGDFAGDGNPYLYVYSSLVSDSFDVYGWTGNSVNLVSNEESYGGRSSGYLYEAPDGTVKHYSEGSGGATLYYQDIISFQDGASQRVYFTENSAPYNTEIGPHSHKGYTCFYDIKPCGLTQMIDYLRQYASVVSEADIQEQPKFIRSPIYQAYYNELIGLQKAYGIGEVCTVENVYSFENLCFAKLLDFNGDGTEELLVVVGERQESQWNVEYMSYQLMVFDYRSGICQKIYSKAPSSGYTDMTEGFYLVYENGAIYLMEISSDGISSTTYALTYRNGEFVRTDDIKNLRDVNYEYYQLNFVDLSPTPDLLLQCGNTIHYLDSNRVGAGPTANPTNDKLTVNGVEQNPTVYKIGDSNYFKIRDLAAVLNGTGKQFSVGYDAEKQSVTAAPGQPYELTGTELAGAADSSQAAQASNDAIYVNGQRVEAEVYKIDGSNYFKLRDLGAALGFEVGWTQEQGMFINTEK